MHGHLNVKYRENSNFIKIRQEQPVIYMKTCVLFCLYLAEFFIGCEMLQTKFVDRIKTHIFIFNNSFFFLRSRDVYEIMWENKVEPGRTQVTIWRMRIA